MEADHARRVYKIQNKVDRFGGILHFTAQVKISGIEESSRASLQISNGRHCFGGTLAHVLTFSNNLVNINRHTIEFLETMIKKMSRIAEIEQENTIMSSSSRKGGQFRARQTNNFEASRRKAK